MGLTFNAMVTALQDHLGITGETTLLERLVNQAKDWYVTAHKWPHLETSTAQLYTTDVRVYQAPGDAKNIVSVLDSFGTPLNRFERETYDKLYRPSVATALAPSAFIQQGSDSTSVHEFQVWPSPTTESTGAIRYLKRVPDLTSTVGTFDHIPEEHHFLIVKKAEANYYAWEDNTQQAQLAETEAQNDLRQLAGGFINPVIEDGAGK